MNEQLIGDLFAAATRRMTGSSSREFSQKFAEEIVRECAKVIAPMGDWCGGHGEPSMPSTMECAKRLKEHFGVTE